MHHRALRTIAIASTLTLVAAACGPGDPPGSGPDAAGSDTTQTLGALDPSVVSTDGAGGGSGSSGGSGAGGSGSGGGGDSTGGGSGGNSGGGGATSPPTGGGGTSAPTTTPPPTDSPADCLYGKWDLEDGTWQLPGSSWGLSGTESLEFTGSQRSVLEFERDYDYVEDSDAIYARQYGNPQPSVRVLGTDLGEYTVVGTTLSFTPGNTVRMIYYLDSATVSTKYVKRLEDTVTFSCSSTALEISDSAYSASYRRVASY